MGEYETQHLGEKMAIVQEALVHSTTHNKKIVCDHFARDSKSKHTTFTRLYDILTSGNNVSERLMGLKSIVPTVVRGGEARLQQLTAAIAQEVPRKGYSAAQTYMLTQQAGTG